MRLTEESIGKRRKREESRSKGGKRQEARGTRGKRGVSDLRWAQETSCEAMKTTCAQLRGLI
jgi:hypothetical protein